MKSFLKFLSRNKLYTAIEAVGLAVSLAFVILIGTYVVQQHQMAHESPYWDKTFVLGNDEMLALTYWDKEEMEMYIPETEAVTHLALSWLPLIETADEIIRATGLETDAQFFDVFPEYRIVEGNVHDFTGKNDILISESLSRRIGKDGESLVGSMLKVNDSEMTIKGVFADFDHTFFMPCDIISHISKSWGAQNSKAFQGIGTYSTWYRVREDADLAELEAKVKAMLHRNYDPSWTAERVEKWRPYRMDEAFFHPVGTGGITRQGNTQMLRLLTVVVLLLLLSAIFNYVNLSLALTGKRSKEMATRRLLGSERGAILMKYIVESVSFTAVCFGAGLVLAYLFAPMLNNLVCGADSEMLNAGVGNTSVRISLMLTPGYIAAYIAVILLLGTVCGILPAYAASRFEPIDVIKGTLRRRNKMVMSRVFIVVQNVLSVFLIAMSLFMEVEMRYMLKRPTHTAQDNLFYIECAARDYDMLKIFKDRVEQFPFVNKVGVGRGLPGSVYMSMSMHYLDNDVVVPIVMCDSTYFQLLGFEVQRDFGHPLVSSLWMSESAFNAAGISDTTNSFAQMMNFNGVGLDYLGGIVHDFPARSVMEYEPNANSSVIIVRSEDILYARCLLIGMTAEDDSYVEQILKAYKDYHLEMSGIEENASNYGFIRDLNRKEMTPLIRTMRLVELFAVLSVVIALLGLLAMSTYFADENTKQIAVRKVFGSDVTYETWRNVRMYMVLVGVACVIGVPLAIWGSRIYLEQLVYKTYRYGWVFPAAIVISVAIAFLSVLWQTVKAARTNPAVELKKE